MDDPAEIDLEGRRCVLVVEDELLILPLILAGNSPGPPSLG